MKNALTLELESLIKNEKKHKGILYISLYGIDNIKNLENKIVYSIVENTMNKKKTNKLKDLFVNSSKIYIDYIDKKDYITSTIKIFQDISNYIIIFDDLERCKIEITEILGYINELVEHKKVKTIIVANQEEMMKNNKYINSELKYLSTLAVDNNESKNIQNLNEKINNLYGENILYNEIKEKLIGEVIYYFPNFNKIIIDIANSISNKIVKRILLDNQNKIIEEMTVLNHFNIRTIKIVLIKFEIIVDKLDT